MDHSWAEVVRIGERAVRIPVSQSYIHTGMNLGTGRRPKKIRTNYEGTVDVKYQRFELCERLRHSCILSVHHACGRKLYVT